MNREYGVRRGSVADLEAVLAIERGCAETSHWSEAIWRSVFEQAREKAAVRGVFVAERAGDVLGFAVVQRGSRDAELEAVAVRAEERRGGVASGLCHHAMAWAAGQIAEGVGAAEMHLEVRAGNAAALRLYAGLGFVEQGRRRGYYRNPVEDAVLMACRLGVPS